MTSEAWTQASNPSARGSQDPSFGGQEEPLSYVLQSQGQAVGAESLGRGEPTARLAARPSCGLHGGGGGQPRGRRTLTGVHRKELVRVVTAAASPTTCLPSAIGAGRAGGRDDMEN